MIREKRARVPVKKLAFLMLAICLGIHCAPPAYATKSEMNAQKDAAKEKKNDLEQEKKRLENTLSKLEGLKSSTASYVRELDASLNVLNAELDTLAIQVSQKEEDIVKTGAELEKAREVEARQYASMKLRIKYMYEHGNISMLELLLNADSLSQMMNRAEYIRQISEYDKQKMDEYAAVCQQIAASESKLKSEQEELLGLEEQTKARQESVETLLAEKNRELAGYESQITDAQGQIDEYARDLETQEARIRQLEEQIRRQEEEERRAAEAAAAAAAAAASRAAEENGAPGESAAPAGSSSRPVTDLGSIHFIWPCPAGKRISSGFGSRSSPTEGASSDHKGIDIPASTGCDIVAAASGTVVISTYSYSAGNYLMINHGGGVYTVYMHCSSLSVSEGQKVSQGQTIGKVGSTGYSTGPHLHFGIRSGGKYIDPSGYVSP